MAEQAKKTECVIAAPNLQRAEFTIIGTAPYVQHKFPQKAKQMMMDKQQQGAQAKKGKAREAKNFQDVYEGAQHKTADGKNGIPASAFRAALISACRLVGFKMTLAKLSVFVEADGFDVEDGSPMVFFTKGTPRRVEHHVRLETGVCDIACRAMWDAGWEANVRITFDAGQFSLADVANLLARAGMQVGIGAGRPDSSSSAGCGWGTFKVSEV